MEDQNAATIKGENVFAWLISEGLKKEPVREAQQSWERRLYWEEGEGHKIQLDMSEMEGTADEIKSAKRSREIHRWGAQGKISSDMGSWSRREGRQQAQMPLLFQVRQGGGEWKGLVAEICMLSEGRKPPCLLPHFLFMATGFLWGLSLPFAVERLEVMGLVFK